MSDALISRPTNLSRNHFVRYWFVRFYIESPAVHIHRRVCGNTPTVIWPIHNVSRDGCVTTLHERRWAWQYAVYRCAI